MGMDLSGKGGNLHYSHVNWRALLELADKYGWKPAGTEPPDSVFYHEDCTVDEEMTEGYRQMYEDWDGSYFGNFCFQWVTDEDAANIADALEFALEKYEKSDEGLSQSAIDYLREFIAFCRAGGFRIA
jgi:hypothetical protein